MKKMFVIFFLVAGLTASSQSPLESPAQATQLSSTECIEKCKADYAQCVSQCGNDTTCRSVCGKLIMKCARICNPGPYGD